MEQRFFREFSLYIEIGFRLKNPDLSSRLPECQKTDFCILKELYMWIGEIRDTRVGKKGNLDEVMRGRK